MQLTRQFAPFAAEAAAMGAALTTEFGLTEEERRKEKRGQRKETETAKEPGVYNWC